MKDKDSIYVKYNLKWVYTISLITFVLAIIFSLISENLVNRLELGLAFVTLIVIILIGIIFDTIGIAVTRADEKPFHSMAAKKIEEAQMAISLVRNAGEVSNFCNDVVGDISGIISGAVGASIILKLTSTHGFENVAFLNTLIASFTAALTVGGKSIGKSYAMIHYESILMKFAKMIDIIEKMFNIEFFKDNKKRR